jgi:glutamyl-tRNA reductase
MMVVIGMSHHTAAVTLRERFAIAEARVPATLELLRATKLADEAVILSTCNRVEIYAAITTDIPRAFRELQGFLLSCANYRDPLTDEIYMLDEPQSIEHLFKVASGLDSMVLGETEILGQLKKAYESARQHNHTGPLLNKAFQKAFNVAKHIRSETNIQRGSVSVGSVAVELAEKIFSSLENRQVMVIGAGETSEKTARALLSRGAKSIIVSNRSIERAEQLAEQLGGRAVRFEDWAREFAAIDIVISSTSAPHYVVDRARLAPLMRLRKNQPLLLIDIAVPRDIEPEVNFLENVYLYNIDDLQAIADDYLKQRQEEIARCETIIQEKARGLTTPRTPGLGTKPPLETGSNAQVV